MKFRWGQAALCQHVLLGIDDALSRVTRISDTTGIDAERGVDFAHAGSARRVARSWSVNDGGALDEIFAQTCDTDAADGYAGLDRYGRTADLAFLRAGESTPFHQYRYGYDSAGNRLFARVTQQLTDQDRSWVYAYDPLGRLVSAERGVMHATDPVIEFSQTIIPSRVSWGLDRLGNWTEPAGSGSDQGRVLEEASAQGVYDQLVLAQDHATDLRNELTGIDTDIGTGSVNTPHTHDASGNLVADGVYYYQYDAFNRLAAVYEQNTLTFDASGSLAGDPNPLGSYTTYTDREYVWGPDYLDECLWQVDRTGAAAFVLQDANFNVVALIDQTGQVLQQFDYDPYGSVRALDELGAYADNRVGFQGLFADRYDADAPIPEMALDAFTTSYARNRDYRPALGRWLQRDPNGMSRGTQDSAFNGREVMVTARSPSIELLYADGLNIHIALGAHPISHTDPMGLFFGLGDTFAANELAADLRSDFMDVALDSFDTIANLFGVDLGHATDFARAGMIGFSFSRLAKDIKPGSCSITKWDGHPKDMPRPRGPFRFITGDEYDQGRKAANEANAALRRANPKKYRGMEIHAIHPVKFGGSPTDPANKIALRTGRHRRELNPWWLRLQRNLERGQNP